MSTYTQILYQVVFGTKHHERTLIKRDRPALFRYIIGLLKKKNCHVYQVNGVEDHLHIIFALHPSVALAELVKDIKLSTTKLFRDKELFPGFGGWQDGYAAFTYQPGARDNLIRYVKNQEEHHRVQTFVKEFRRLLNDHQIAYDEKHLL